MKLAALKPDTKNANRGTPRGRKMVEQSLRSYGAGRSILIDKNGHIIAGNKTAEGAKAAGIKDVVVVKSDGSKLVAVQRTDLAIDDREARELAIADNRASEVSLEWDPNVLAELEKGVNLETFWSAGELEKLLADVRGPKEAPEPKLDKAAELQQKYGTARGQIWEIGKHRLMCGDSLNGHGIMAKQKADCVFTSPPYGVGIDYGTYQDTIENLRELLPKLARMAMDSVCHGGYAVINFGDIVSGGKIVDGEGPCEYPMALEHWPAFREVGWRLWSRGHRFGREDRRWRRPV